MRILLTNRDPQPDDALRATYLPDIPELAGLTSAIETGMSPRAYIGHGIQDSGSRQIYRIVDAELIGDADDREVIFGVVRDKSSEGPEMD